MIKVAVIGTGVMGLQHARVYNELYPLCKLEAVCDVKKDASDIAKRLNAEFFTDFKEMIRTKGIEAVSIATPNQFHHEMAKWCLENGVNVLVEKPITTTTEDAEDLIRTAKANGKQLMVGHVERFNPAVQYVKSKLDELVGEVFYVSTKRLGAYPQRLLAGKNGGINIYLDLAIHDIDVIRFLLDSDLKAKSNVSLHKISDSTEDYASVTFESGKKTICNVESSWLSPVKIRELVINGKKGLVKIDYISQDVLIYPAKTEASFRDYSEFLLLQNYEAVRPFVNKKEPLKVEIEHFLNCVKDGVPNMSDGLNGLENLRIIKGLQGQ